MEVDQSNKIEQTERNTVLALSNDVSVTILLHRKDKRLLQEIFKRTGHSRFFPYFIFSALLAILLKEVLPKNKVRVDHEYGFYEQLILERTHAYLKLLGVKSRVEVEFGHVGKTSKVHGLASDVSVRGKKATIVAKLEEVLKLVFSNEKDQDPENRTRAT